MLLISLAASATLLPATGASAAPGVTPASVDVTLAPGGSIDVNKAVETATVSSSPDILFLADTTGSMGGEIANVQAAIGDIISQVRAVQPDAQFGAAQYKDDGDVFAYNLDSAITANDVLVTAAVNTWAASGGGDLPEGQINALFHLGSDAAVGWRPGSSHIIVQFGDAPGHDPSLTHTLNQVITALTGPLDVRYLGIDVLALDSVPNESSATTGQATLLANATGGLVLPGGGDVSQAILDGLSSLDATVEPVVGTCDPNIVVTFDSASQTVSAGDTAHFVETITLSTDATPGAVLSCEVTFTVNGGSDPAFVESDTVTVESGSGAQFSMTVDTSEGGTLLINPQGSDNLGTTGKIKIAPQPGPATDVVVSASLFGLPGETDATCGGELCIGQGIEWSVSNPGAIKKMRVKFIEAAKLTRGHGSAEDATIYYEGVPVADCAPPVHHVQAMPCVIYRFTNARGGWIITLLVTGTDPKGRL